MLICKSPYRISCFGGSCDYKSFYSQHEAFLIGFAFNRYSYISLNNTEQLTDIDYQAYYSEVEKVKNIRDIKNPGIRGPLQFVAEKYPIQNVSVYVQNELPSQTGIGSSSSLIVGLLNLLYQKSGFTKDKKSLAKDAIYVERILLNEAGGIQDQIFASYGGLNSITIKKDGDFNVRPIPISEDDLLQLKMSSILFYTNNRRQSYKIAQSHDNKNSEQYKLEIKDLAHEMYPAFCNGNIEKIGLGLSKSWDMKKQISSLISNDKIDDVYDRIIKSGAFGAKLLGTGGSGFFYTLVPPEKKQQIISRVQLPYIEPSIDTNGAKIIFGDL